jgi:hypothetical protein
LGFFTIIHREGVYFHRCISKRTWVGIIIEEKSALLTIVLFGRRYVTVTKTCCNELNLLSWALWLAWTNDWFPTASSTIKFVQYI